MARTITAQLDRDLVERVRQKAIKARRSMSAQAAYYIELGMRAESGLDLSAGQARETADNLAEASRETR